MEWQLKQEIVNEINMIKGLVKQSEIDGEISKSTRSKLMQHLGAAKNILYTESPDFKQYQSNRMGR